MAAIADKIVRSPLSNLQLSIADQRKEQVDRFLVGADVAERGAVRIAVDRSHPLALIQGFTSPPTAPRFGPGKMVAGFDFKSRM